MDMRTLIAGMRMSLDGKIGNPDGYADWVESWSDGYDVISRADTCVLGGGMYPGYEGYWTAVRNAPDQPLPMTGRMPTPEEVAYARFTAQTPHYVLSTTLTTAAWPTTRFLRGLEDVAALKKQSGKDIYLVGGARTTSGLIEAGLVDELQLIAYPLLVGEGKPLFATTKRRRGLELRKVQELQGGRVRLIYGIDTR
jgi:dihydrofolate reductase